MTTQLHPTILAHAANLAKHKGIPTSQALSELLDSSPDYFRELPFWTRPKEKHAPLVVTPHFIKSLKAEASRLNKTDGIRYSDALDLVAVHAGFHQWRHAMKLASEFEEKVSPAIANGFALGLWYPQRSWTNNQWDPNTLQVHGFTHDPRLIFAGAENLKLCFGRDNDDGEGYAGLSYPHRNNDGALEYRANTGDFLRAVQADYYHEHNNAGLHFFRYTGTQLPSTLDEARESVEHALGRIRWNPQDPNEELVFEQVPVSEFCPVPVFQSVAKINVRDQGLPPLRNQSNLPLHVPVVHHVWLRGVFTELDYYYF
jgi:hypothetical protein